MTEDRELHRAERDNNLIGSLAHRAGDLRGYFRKWIVLEAKQLEIDLSWLIPQCTDAQSRASLELKQRRVYQITYDELSAHLEYLEDSVENLRGGATDDVVKDMWELEDGINYLRGLVRELRDIRSFLDDIIYAEDELTDQNGQE